MIRKSILWLLGIGLSLNAYSTDDERYTYILDLTKVENDQLVVTLITPNISESEINFYMPKIIPGTYRIADYGRFVSDLKAFNKKTNNYVPAHLEPGVILTCLHNKR